jgi:DNA-binding FrmR family transcriptional regulator
LNFDKAARETLRTAREDCERLERARFRYEELKRILARGGEIESDVAANLQDVAENATRLQQLAAEGETLRDVGTQIAACEQTLNRISIELDEARTTEREASTDLGRQHGVLEECERREAERDRIGRSAQRRRARSVYSQAHK